VTGSAFSGTGEAETAAIEYNKKVAAPTRNWLRSQTSAQLLVELERIQALIGPLNLALAQNPTASMLYHRAELGRASQEGARADRRRSGGRATDVSDPGVCDDCAASTPLQARPPPCRR